MTDFILVAGVADVPPDTHTVVTVAGRSILIVHHDGGLFAVENRCSHADQPLDCGRIRWGWIACPAHGAKFDLASGAALSQPATDPIATFALRVVGDRIEIAV
ncbi:Rieske 2Fe-2S domain-containing protein [Sphingomonas ginsenosidivorax]|uniref:Rieske 2Fe-2S domain-containing protein n=1 Tax=Sphingomonas ginsenosidivorax TaxID=862135 RepID=A0A5C6UC51_9SPHN|nr:Rieske 2Fe-2S domain-containing protein [Sphingomonas ginsenosidivorax]TXC70279.1 Rieske 2Fe-2S domain-containing protein [Sphingomonas ginsenosidivorax]